MNMLYLLFGVGFLIYMIHWMSHEGRRYPYHPVAIAVLSTLVAAIVVSDVVRPTIAFKMPVGTHIRHHVEVKTGQPSKVVHEARYEHQRMLWDWERSKFVKDGPVEVSEERSTSEKEASSEKEAP